MSTNDIQAFRECLGKFATGVTVVTCQGAHGPCGITANSFSSVSLEPPLILWSIDKISNSLRAYLDAGHFAVNVLQSGQQGLATHFARSNGCTFDGLDFSLNERGVPLLDRSLARLECRTREVIEAGDHYVIIGEVESFAANSGEPLLFFGSRYMSI